MNITERTRGAIYWNGEKNEVRRCSWFYKGIDSRFIPYEETTATQLEEEYRDASNTGEWHRTIPLTTGETVVFNGPSVIVHFLSSQSPDAWPTNSTVPVSVFCDAFFFFIFHIQRQNDD